MTDHSDDFDGFLNLLLVHDDVAHVIVDPLRAHTDPNYDPYDTLDCDPDQALEMAEAAGTEETQLALQQIDEAMEIFDDLQIPQYAVCSRENGGNHETSFGGLSIAKPNLLTVDPFPKETESGLDGTDLANTLEYDAIETIILTGFNTSDCYFKTAVEALNSGFNLIILMDCSANDKFAEANRSAQRAFEELQSMGAILLDLDDLQEYYQTDTLDEVLDILTGKASPTELYGDERDDGPPGMN